MGLIDGLLSGGIGIAAPAIAAATGIGMNNTRARSFDESAAYNPNATQYGGRAGAADQTANRFSGLAGDAQGRAGAHVNYGNANAWQQGNAYDRANQGRVADMMMARAQGLVPSIASQQAALDMSRATAAQSSAAASARGAGGLALAGQNAANNTATMQSAISNQAQVNAAQERLGAEQGAYGAYSGMRAGDAQAQGLAAQQAQYQAMLQQQQRQQNDAYSLGLYGQENNVRQMQLQGGIANQGLLGQSQMYSTGQNVAISQNNANREYDYYKQAMGGLQGGMDSAMMSGGPAPNVPQPATGVSAPTAGMAPGGGANMVGIPQPTGSDDRMKFGVSPLGLLGVWGGGGQGMQPASGPVGSGASGAAPASYEVLSGGGENVAASGQAMNRVATQYQNDPTGGMGAQGLLSDDNAKRAAYMLGRQDGAEQIRSGSQVPYGVGSPLGDGEEFFVGGSGPEIRHAQGATTKRDQQHFIDAAVQAAGNERRMGSSIDRDAQYMGPARSADPVTDQFAQGLAPIRFQYKPGMGPGGEQTGVRAQAAASQPVTSSMVTQRPDGLLQLDPQMGLGTALAGVGHLAKKQQENEAKLNGLLAMAARREGY